MPREKHAGPLPYTTLCCWSKILHFSERHARLMKFVGLDPKRNLRYGICLGWLPLPPDLTTLEMVVGRGPSNTRMYKG